MFLMGQLLETGKGDAPNYEQAAAYYEAAAQMGHAEAQARLAQLYEEGWGVPQNFHTANKWYRAPQTHKGNTVRTAECRGLFN